MDQWWRRRRRPIGLRSPLAGRSFSFLGCDLICKRNFNYKFALEWHLSDLDTRREAGGGRLPTRSQRRNAILLRVCALILFNLRLRCLPFVILREPPLELGASQLGGAALPASLAKPRTRNWCAAARGRPPAHLPTCPVPVSVCVRAPPLHDRHLAPVPKRPSRPSRHRHSMERALPSRPLSCRRNHSYMGPTG